MEAVIQRALGAGWERLAPVVRRHYDLRVDGERAASIRGVMAEVHHNRAALPFLWFGRLFGALVPYRGRQVPVTVRNWVEEGSPEVMRWHRVFRFPGREPWSFRSTMEHVQGDEIVETVRFGMAIRMAMSERNGALLFEGRGYRWRIGGFTLHLPEWLILGHGRIVEEALSETRFRIEFEMRHPLLGRTFAYSGEFELEEPAGPAGARLPEGNAD
ncbi:DUF4166 domain-containing protein [Endothiovibrio diazotrophicus]